VDRCLFLFLDTGHFISWWIIDEVHAVLIPTVYRVKDKIVELRVWHKQRGEGNDQKEVKRMRMGIVPTGTQIGEEKNRRLKGYSKAKRRVKPWALAPKPTRD